MQQALTSPLVDLFLELCALPSPSGKERAVADRVCAYLTELGLEWDEDGAAAKLDGDAGNIYCRIPPTNGTHGTPIFLCAHTDTVPPEAAIDPVVGEDGIVRNAGGTILGSDNKAAVVAMLEGVRRVLDEGREHAGIELLFTPQEEVSLRGADAFDHTRFVATTGYVYDQGAPIGEIVLGSPHARLLDFRFHGTAAHAGMHPEDGRSAIAAGVACDRGLPPRARRRGDERERRGHLGRDGAERRSGVVLVHRRGALPRRAEGRRARARDARERGVRSEPRRLRGRVGGPPELPRLSVPRERCSRATRGDRARAGGLHTVVRA